MNRLADMPEPNLDDVTAGHQGSSRQQRASVNPAEATPETVCATPLPKYRDGQANSERQTQGGLSKDNVIGDDGAFNCVFDDVVHAGDSSITSDSVKDNFLNSKTDRLKNNKFTKKNINIVLATGGTGGHIYPAIAVAEALHAAGYEVQVIGQKRGLEEQLVPAAGLRFVGVSAGKLDRQRPNPLAVMRALWGVLEAVWHVAKVTPAWVIGFGGFASFPALAAAWLLRRPIAVHEANAYPGLVTKLFARAARVVAAADPAVQARLPQRVQVVPVGLPIRTGRITRADARRQLGLPLDALVTLVMGGSQGAKILNNAVPQAYDRLAHEGEHVVLHSAGQGRVLEVTAASDTYRVVPYVDATLAWSAADIAITRAGSSTLAEAAFYGVPLIMVPFAAAAEQHQLHNALAVEASGAGVVVEEHHVQVSVDPLVSAWQRLCDAAVRQQAQQAALLRAYPQAAERLLVALNLTSGDLTSGDLTSGGSTSEDVTSALLEDKPDTDIYESMPDTHDDQPDAHAVGARHPDAKDVHVKHDREHYQERDQRHDTHVNHNKSYNIVNTSKNPSNANHPHTNAQESS